MENVKGATGGVTVTGGFSDGTQKDLTDHVVIWQGTSIYGDTTNVVEPIANGTYEVTEGGDGVITEMQVQNADPFDFPDLGIKTKYKMVVGEPVAEKHQGQWLIVHSGEQRWIGDYYPLSLSEVETDLLKAKPSTGSTEYYVRAGIPDVAVQGALRTLNDTSSTSGATLAGASGYKGVGGINVILRNLEDDEVKNTVTTDSQGRFSDQVPSGDYEVEAETQDSSGQTTTVKATMKVEGEEDDLGVFTLTPPEDFNFKTQLLADDYGANSDSELIYFGTLSGQEPITYTKKLKITNIGQQDASGLSYNVSSDDPDVKSLTVSGTPTGLAPGDAFTIDLTMSFNRPAAEKTVVLDVVLTDLNSRTWKDTLSVKLSPHPPFPVYTATDTYDALGYLIAPGRRPIQLKGDDQIYVPFVAGNSYEMMVSVPDITQETAYALGIGASIPSGVMNNFSNTSVNEPDDQLSEANTMGLYDQQVAYLHTGDIDYYNLTVGSGDVLFEPLEIGAIESYSDGTTLDVVRSVEVVGNYAYLATEGSGSNGSSLDRLQVVDISDPTAPTIVGNFTLPGYGASEVEVSGNYAYVGADYWVQVVDISDPTNPTYADRMGLGSTNNIRDLTVSGNFLYAVGRYSGDINFAIIDITDPTAVTRPSTLALSANPQAIAHSGNHVYVAYSEPSTGSEDILQIDVSDPANPVVQGNLPHFSDHSIQGLAVKGDTLFASNGEIYAFDISSPSSIPEPALVASRSYGSVGPYLEVNGDWLLAFGSNDGWSIVDIADPTNPKLIPTNRGGAVHGVERSAGYVVGDTVYLGNRSQVLSVTRWQVTP
jgi:hypothetical protein